MLKIKHRIKETNILGEPDGAALDRGEAAGLEEKERLKGGSGDNKPDSSFDPTQLKIGIKDETGEHTPNKEIGKEIAKDHLSQDKDYYRKLKAAGIDEKIALKEEERKAEIKLSTLLGELEQLKNKIWVFFDTETTGMDPRNKQLTELAAIAVDPDFLGGDGSVLGQYHQKIALTAETEQQLNSSDVPVGGRNNMSVKDVLKMTKYFDSQSDKAEEGAALHGFIKFIKQLESTKEVILVAHNAKFDRMFVSVRSAKYGLPKLNNKTVDTLQLVYDVFYPLVAVADTKNILKTLHAGKRSPSFTLGSLAQAFEIKNENWHTAVADVENLIKITQSIVNYVKQEKDIDVRKGVEKSKSLQRYRSSFGTRKPRPSTTAPAPQAPRTK